MNRFLTIIFIFSFVANGIAQDIIELQLLENGFTRPVDIEHAGDERLFIAEQPGSIHIMAKDGVVNSVPFLDIREKVRDNSNEQGLLGLVFHPDYANNGYFYVNYTFGQGNTRISRFSRSADNPDLADPDSEKVIWEIGQPFSNHNAGDMNFGPDGMLYIGSGDGGSGGDPDNVSQNRRSLLGKMLRIDVDNGDPYSIPNDNPFADTDETLDEIWAIGLRNPWRFSFDRATGDMYIGDVGQSSREEIHFQPADSKGGENYGWRCYEGNEPFSTRDCDDPSSLTGPIHEYRHLSRNSCGGGSVTGGYVYRGKDYPGLVGKYLYAEYCFGNIWALERNGDGEWVNEELYRDVSGRWTTFGQDNNGELYIASRSGGISKITLPGTTSTDTASDRLQLTVLTNPFDVELSIKINTEESGFAQFRIIDITGRTLHERDIQIFKDTNFDVDTELLSSGIYLAEIQFEGRRTVAKVIKK